MHALQGFTCCFLGGLGARHARVCAITDICQCRSRQRSFSTSDITPVVCWWWGPSSHSACHVPVRDWTALTSIPVLVRHELPEQDFLFAGSVCSFELPHQCLIVMVSAVWCAHPLAVAHLCVALAVASWAQRGPAYWDQALTLGLREQLREGWQRWVTREPQPVPGFCKGTQGLVSQLW
jgi:hypothetical protein